MRARRRRPLSVANITIATARLLLRVRYEIFCAFGRWIGMPCKA